MPDLWHVPRTMEFSRFVLIGMTAISSPAWTNAAEDVQQPAQIQSLDTAEIQKVFAGLQSPRFSERTESQIQVSDLAGRVPEELRSRLQGAPIEVQLRILRSLEIVFLSDDGKSGDNAERAIYEISKANVSVAEMAQVILSSNSSLRETRARKTLQRLGVKLVYSDEISSGIGRGSLRSQPKISSTPEPVLQEILISEDWTGTTADLWHLRRFAHYTGLKLYNMRSNGLQMADLQALSEDLIGLEILERGGGLGIKDPGRPTMVVNEIRPGTPADRAGLRPGDLILFLNEHEVQNFSQLVEILYNYKPGEVITLQVQRGETVIPIEVKLASWKEMQLVTEKDVIPGDFGGPLGQSRPAPPLPPERIRTGVPRLRME